MAWQCEHLPDQRWKFRKGDYDDMYEKPRGSWLQIADFQDGPISKSLTHGVQREHSSWTEKQLTIGVEIETNLIFNGSTLFNPGRKNSVFCDPMHPPLAFVSRICPKVSVSSTSHKIVPTQEEENNSKNRPSFETRILSREP